MATATRSTAAQGADEVTNPPQVAGVPKPTRKTTRKTTKKPTKKATGKATGKPSQTAAAAALAVKNRAPTGQFVAGAPPRPRQPSIDSSGSESSDSGDTVALSFIEETPPGPSSSRKSLHKEIDDYLRKCLNQSRVHKSYRKHKRSRRYKYEGVSSTDSEDDGEPKVSFLHHYQALRKRH